ncbi:molybdopterin cofactor-binding domain-containing protein [Streptomyces sp. NPDC002076]
MTRRGAGRPEATIALERSIDLPASRLGMDPVELRRRNFTAPESFPYQTPTGRAYGSGDYAAALDEALETRSRGRGGHRSSRRQQVWPEPNPRLQGQQLPGDVAVQHVQNALQAQLVRHGPRGPGAFSGQGTPAARSVPLRPWNHADRCQSPSRRPLAAAADFHQRFRNPKETGLQTRRSPG